MALTAGSNISQYKIIARLGSGGMGEVYLALDERLRRKVASDALVDIDTVRYSVPHRLVRTEVEVLVGESQVRIYSGAELVASHARTIEPHTSVIDFAHYRGLWRASPQLPAAEPPRALEALGRSLADYEAAVLEGAR